MFGNTVSYNRDNVSVVPDTSRSVEQQILARSKWRTERSAKFGREKTRDHPHSGPFCLKKLQGGGMIFWYNFMVGAQILQKIALLTERKKETSVCCVRAHRTKVLRFVRTQKRYVSGRTKGDGAARGGGTGRGRNGMRRGDTTTSRTRVARAEE